MRRTRMTALACGAALVAGSAFAGVAEAGPPERGTFEFEGTEIIEDLCEVEGLAARHDFSGEGRFLFRAQGPDGLPYYGDHARITDVYTILATGEAFTVQSTVNFKDLRVTDNGDGTSTIVAMETGNRVLYGPDGTVLARGPGQARFAFLVDNGGTPTDASDDEFLAFLGDLKFPSGDDFCAQAE